MFMLHIAIILAHIIAKRFFGVIIFVCFLMVLLKNAPLAVARHRFINFSLYHYNVLICRMNTQPSEREPFLISY